MDRYAVVGHPVAHSKSPMIHQAFARATRRMLSYELPGSRPSMVSSIRCGVSSAEGGKGLNVTMPFQARGYAVAREHSTRARPRPSACKRSRGAAITGMADNTDGVGLMRDMTHNVGETLAGRDVLVLGAGGAARGILRPLLMRVAEKRGAGQPHQRRAAELDRRI